MNSSESITTSREELAKVMPELLVEIDETLDNPGGQPGLRQVMENIAITHEFAQTTEINEAEWSEIQVAWRKLKDKMVELVVAAQSQGLIENFHGFKREMLDSLDKMIFDIFGRKFQIESEIIGNTPGKKVIFGQLKLSLWFKRELDSELRMLETTDGDWEKDALAETEKPPGDLVVVRVGETTNPYVREARVEPPSFIEGDFKEIKEDDSGAYEEKDRAENESNELPAPTDEELASVEEELLPKHWASLDQIYKNEVSDGGDHFNGVVSAPDQEINLAMDFTAALAKANTERTDREKRLIILVNERYNVVGERYALLLFYAGRQKEHPRSDEAFELMKEIRKKLSHD